MGIQKVRTSPYHAQTNGQLEGAYQMLMHMIGKLSKDQKADWLSHLPKLVHAYNSEISHHWIQPAVFDVWVPTALTHLLLFPHNKGHEETPVC